MRQQKCLDFILEDEYDLAGFAVGVVDKKDLITGEASEMTGDVLIGMASIRSSLAMDFLLCVKYLTWTKETLDTYYDELGTTLGRGVDRSYQESM